MRLSCIPDWDLVKVLEVKKQNLKKKVRTIRRIFQVENKNNEGTKELFNKEKKSLNSEFLASKQMS